MGNPGYMFIIYRQTENGGDGNYVFSVEVK
jgi:hypothetical protein